MKTSDKNDKVKIKVQKVALKLKKLKFPIGFIESDQLSKLAKEIIEAQRVFAEQIRSIIENWKSVSQFISKQFEIKEEVLKRWIEWNREISKSGLDFMEAIEKSVEVSIQEAARVLRKYKWVITPSLPAVFVFDVVKIGNRKRNQRKVLNQLFVEHFSSNDFREMDLLIAQWEKNKILKPRTKIFRDCIFVLRMKKRKFNPSNIVLPTLIAQIDGILTEFMKNKGLFFDTKERKWKDNKGKIIYKKMWFKEQVKSTKENAMTELSNEIFLNLLLQKAYPIHPLKSPFSFNRHKILHGENLRYGRIDNTIRAFLILDFLDTITRTCL